MLGRDVIDWAPEQPAVLDETSAIYPIANLAALKPGRYAVQAMLHQNPDLNLRNAPGDLFSPVVNVQIDQHTAGPRAPRAFAGCAGRKTSAGF